MLQRTKFFIDGAWVSPITPREVEVINPATEQAFATISMGSKEDVDAAVAAARLAFRSWSITSKAERLDWLSSIQAAYDRRMPDIAAAISQEMGAPISLSQSAQAPVGAFHMAGIIQALEKFDFEHDFGPSGDGNRIHHEPIGVCGLITPWNWPMNQVTLKVLPALAAGCTVLLKPSEVAPISSMVFAEVIEEAGLPAGVFNLVNGDGATVGEAMSSHPDIDMMSFTGSTRAGIAVATGAARTVKRVTLELGGKSPNLIFADCDVKAAVERGVMTCFQNSGQSCDAPTRMLVERSVYSDAVKFAAAFAEAVKVGDPAESGDHIGPLANSVQFTKVQSMIVTGIEEGARLIAGGTGRPDNLTRGYYVKPTIFADVAPEMTIAREEIFGPVLIMMPFDDEEHAIEMANDTPYGLAAYVQTDSTERLRRVTRQLRAGMVHANGAYLGAGMPFGGYKQSGLGREGGRWGIEDFLEIKAVTGWK